MSIGDKISSLLKRCGATHKNVSAYGGQVVVTCYGCDSAKRIAVILKRSTFKIRGVIKSVDDTKHNDGTRLHPIHDVWRVFACVQ